jgi:GT2 family glycosyltransferase
MTNNQSIAIIVVNWKKYDLTFECIDSVLASSLENFKIILIDNEFQKNKLSRYSTNKKIKVIQNEKNDGFAKANNQGIIYALEKKYDYILLLNNDTIIRMDLIEKLVESSQSNNLSIIQPLILNRNGDKIWNGGGTINKYLGTFNTNLKDQNFTPNLIFNLEIDWFTGCCCFFNAQVFRDVGLFDENFFAYYEDVDYSLRLKSKGYVIGLLTNTYLFHYGSMSSKSQNSFGGKLSPYVHYLAVRNHIYLLKKHSNLFNAFGVFLNQFFKILSYSFYFFLRLRFVKFKMVYNGLIDGLKMEQLKK